MSGIILLRGGGDLASGVALRLVRAGLRVVVVELAEPLAVRRTVSFASAVMAGEIQVEEIRAQRVNSCAQAIELLERGRLPVLVDPELASRFELNPLVVVDGRMTKRPPEAGKELARLVVGLGPGFSAGDNCHVVVETQRGPYLGRLIWSGSAEPDSGLPDLVSAPNGSGTQTAERVLRAPADGVMLAHATIGDVLDAGAPVAEVAGSVVYAPFRGLLRGLLQPGLAVTRGLKIGDLDPRTDERLAKVVSDKALAVGGGVLEAILTRVEIRQRLWDNK
jgi:xanthine dehydrogenase accessory factor